ncbi:stage II sporulation protein M [Candidatus Woesearchaeota archaeon]|nr:stage II sporulation protein M [Candidatus Woesearchaeota archaeon]
MVIESLISVKNAEKHPKEMIFFGGLYSLVAVFISFWVFREYSSIVLVFLTTMAASPLIYKMIKYEEKKDTQGYSEKNLLKEHAKALSSIMWMFIGVTLMLTLIYMALPQQNTITLFDAQISTLTQLNGQATASYTFFSRIFFNNIRVLVFCILFSFLYGIGALFILNWNASVIAVALGNFILEKISEKTAILGGIGVGGYLSSVTSGLLRYSLHGIPEILAYVIAGLAGGIISVAIIRYDFTTKNFEKILFDTSNLLVLSIGVLFFAAIIEVYITPLFF